MTTPPSSRGSRVGIAARLTFALTMFTAGVSVGVPAGPAHADTQVAELHEPGVVLHPVADGRLRSCGMALTVTGVARSDHAGAGYELVRAPAGFSMVVFSLRVTSVGPPPDQVPNEPQCATTAAIVAGNSQIPVPDDALSLSGDRILAFSLAKSQTSVFLELDSAGFSQRFDLLAGRRDGPAPLALYRDPQRPDVLVNPTDTAAAPIAMAAQNMTATFTAGIVHAQLTEFQPGASSGTAPAGQAYLRVWVGYESGPAANGDRIDDLGEIPADHLHLVLPDGRTITAAHAGPDDDRYAFPGIYYFTVPDTLTAATVRLDPVRVAAVDVAGGVVHSDIGRPTGPATIGALILPVRLPDVTQPVVGAGQPVAPTPSSTQTGPADHHRGWPWLALGVTTTVVILLGSLLVAARRRRRPESSPEAADGSVAWIVTRIHWPALLARLPALTLTGPGAAPALRAAASAVIESGGTVIADGPTASGPLTGLPIRTAPSAEQALTDAHAATVETHRDHEPGLSNGDRHTGSPRSVLVAVHTIPDHHHRTAATLTQDPEAPLNLISAVAWDGSVNLNVDPAGIITAAEHHPDLVGRHLPITAVPTTTDRLPPVPPHPIIAPPPPSGTSPQALPEADAKAESAPAPPPPVGPALRTFGTVTIRAAGRELTSGLRAKAVELAAFLAWHRDGATLDAIIDALFPDADPKRGADQFHTVAANLRTAVRAATGTNAPVIERVAKRYQLQPDLFDVDLWNFTDKINTPGGASALGLYAGEFAADIDATWILGPRQTLRRTALDATSRLAADAPTATEAVRVAEHAITIDPYDEAGYQLVISHQVGAGDTAAADRTYALLQARLAELDLAPSPAVTSLIRR